ncbi:aminoglycoside phosphotransferase family protein [Streptomyces tailanensis]|uniref:aminoglycoside phosphotransferase family protein n=1 Tax=Streptomyces tailanensis TaxID=2569858 RepID=UPI00122E0F8F|nr:aminoglycoside phosphotransferase family protein [Streptomyces tailanensis]
MSASQDSSVPTAERPVPDLDLARRLVREQFPQWAELPLCPVEPQGWDNRTFRLGSDLAVRIPSARGYDAQVEKEHRWLPVLAEVLPLPIPKPVAKGAPGPLFDGPWSVYAWYPGQTLNRAGAGEADLAAVAVGLGEFLTALRATPTQDAPPPGTHNSSRGAEFTVYADEAILALAGLVPEVREVGERCVRRATESSWIEAPVWLHGDIAPGNLLLSEGRLSAVIDFGCSAVGDPACDLVAAWTMFDRETRPLFVRAAGLDQDTWHRAQGWAAWKSAITLAGADSTPEARSLAERTLAELAEDVAQQA